MQSNWEYIVAVVVIVGGIIYVILARYFKTKREIAQLNGSSVASKILEENTEMNSKVLQKLDALESRLATVEKTLTDI